MKKCLLLMICLVHLAVASFAQAKPKPVVKQSIPELKKLLDGTKLPYKIVNDSLAIIPFEGENIPSFDVLVQRVSDLYIVYTNLSEILPAKIEGSKYKYLLERSDHFDIIKISMSAGESIVYVRADLYKNTVTTPVLTRVIRQVANVTNIIAGDLK